MDRVCDASTRDPERRSPSGMPPFVRHDMAVPHRRPHTLKDTVMNHASMIRLGLLSLIACTAFASASAMAADTTVPGHPRVNEVNQRIEKRRRSKAQRPPDQGRNPPPQPRGKPQ
jgi:hypothetical protein